MATTITTVALGKWDDRANLNYAPCNNKLANGRRYNAFGVPISQAGDPAETRRPYKVEEDGGTVYVMYDDDSNGDAVIFKMVEA